MGQSPIGEPKASNFMLIFEINIHVHFKLLWSHKSWIRHCPSWSLLFEKLNTTNLHFFKFRKIGTLKGWSSPPLCLCFQITLLFGVSLYFWDMGIYFKNFNLTWRSIMYLLRTRTKWHILLLLTLNILFDFCISILTWTLREVISYT